MRDVAKLNGLWLVVFHAQLLKIIYPCQRKFEGGMWENSLCVVQFAVGRGMYPWLTLMMV